MELRTAVVCVFSLLVSSALAQDCSSGGSCSSGGRDGNVTYQVASVVRGSDAVDLCLVVSADSAMTNRHRWLQSVVALLEDELSGMGIGTVTLNRYCLVQFGGRGRHLTGMFLRVGGSIFFSKDDFVHARRQLQKKGDVADGYEAVEFTTKNAPFRVNPRVFKAILLVTNMGRSVLSQTNVTRDSLFSLLMGHAVSLSTVVNFDIWAGGGTALGLHGTHQASVLSNGGQNYSLVQGDHVQYSSNAGGTIHDYVTFAVGAGGSSWPIDLVLNANLTVLATMVRVYIAESAIHPTSTVEVCEQCDCVQVGGGGCVRRDCVEAVNQEECRCLSSRPPSECVSPSPVSPTDESSILNPQPTQTPRPLVITGTVDQFPGGDVELNFQSTINRASYECILVTGDTDTPTLHPCTSPYYLKNVVAGDHSLLVIGRRRDSVGTRLFDFEIAPSEGGVAPSITLTSVPAGNNSVHIEIVPEGFRGEAELLCSVDSGPFHECGTSRLLTSAELGEKGVLFIVVAIGNQGLISAASLHVEKPVTRPTGNVMVSVTRVDPPDPFGRIRIGYNSSHDHVVCLCRVNFTVVDCQSREYLADPRVLGAGTHMLSITCMDLVSLDGYSDTKRVKFVLTLPPTPPPGPLSCDVHVTTEEQRLLASYTCDRRVMATCQVSSLPLNSCNSPSGMYEADIGSLGAGAHVFILSVDDGFGKLLMKIIPFFVGTAHRKCCPVIGRNSSVINVTSSHQYEVQLDVTVAPGNCSVTEGFSYSINWGDGARESGMLQTLSPIQSTRQYQASGSYRVAVSFCNSPSNELNTCCDSFEWSIQPH